VPLWGGVPAQRCVQLGYYCLQLPAMYAEPEKAGSRESGESDMRSLRRHNPLTLPADADGVPSWNNLVADLVALLEHFRPEVLVTPHPQLDPHADHLHATGAVQAAVERQRLWKPETLLLYANHLHDNDRWPRPADGGVALPPCIEALPADPLWSPRAGCRPAARQAQALAMQHDLQGRCRQEALAPRDPDGVGRAALAGHRRGRVLPQGRAPPRVAVLGAPAALERDAPPGARPGQRLW
jgi:hypothetical protein